LRLVAAQSAGPSLWLGARAAAILAWSLPAVLLAVVVALGVAGVSFTSAWPELIAALLLIAAYMLLWTGIATLVLSRLPGAASALGALTAIWTVLAIGLPLLGAILISALSPPPSGVAHVDIRRRTVDEIEAERDAILKRAIAARPDPSAAQNRIDDMDYATKLTFLAPETEKRLAPFHRTVTAHADQQAGIAAFAAYLAPPLGLETALATLAGTDSGRHRAFEVQTRAYQLRLRGILYPLVQKEIADPTPLSEPATRGRFNLTERDLPAFAMREEPSATRVVAALPLAVWLLLLGGMLTALGLRRADNWPREL
jgi:ABC-2 type transport system permease protein